MTSWALLFPHHSMLLPTTSVTSLLVLLPHTPAKITSCHHPQATLLRSGTAVLDPGGEDSRGRPRQTVLLRCDYNPFIQGGLPLGTLQKHQVVNWVSLSLTQRYWFPLAWVYFLPFLLALLSADAKETWPMTHMSQTTKLPTYLRGEAGYLIMSTSVTMLPPKRGNRRNVPQI